MTDAIQIVTTAADRGDAVRIAEHLVGRRLAACVQISGPIESTYRWEGEVQRSQEWVCTAKTLADLYADVERAIREVHPYEEPEILAVPVSDGSHGYLKWLADQVAS